MKYFLAAVLFIYSLVAVSNEKSTHSQSMGSVSVYDDYHTNCSFSALLEQTEVCLGYHNSYFLPELGETTLHISFPTAKLVHSYTLSTFGYSDYNDITAKVSLARMFTPRMSAGISTAYILHHHVGAEKGMSGFFVSPGIYCYFTEDNLLACYAEIGSQPLFIDNYKLTYSAFVAYNLTINTYVNWATEIGVDNNDFIGRMGFSYKVEKFSLRCGASLMPIRPSAGIGFEINCFDFSYAADYCNTLGTRMSLGFCWKIQNKKRNAK
ncbi:MAG: hypothetical protein U0K66_11550 [Paludibacteraceae bacterium]|nr:hypothetical protein [Paludibacteraceae bacterium]